MPKKIKKKKRHQPKIPPSVTDLADLRLLKTLGKKTLVQLAGKKSSNWESSLNKTTFVRKGIRRTYTAKSIGYKQYAMTKLRNYGVVRDLLFDIYYQPSRVSIKIRKLAGQYYKRMCPGRKLPPMVI